MDSIGVSPVAFFLGAVTFSGGLATGVALVRLLSDSPATPKPKSKHPARTAAGKKAMKSNGFADRFRCDVCGLESNMGGMASHQKAAGHVGKTRVG